MNLRLVEIASADFYLALLTILSVKVNFDDKLRSRLARFFSRSTSFCEVDEQCARFDWPSESEQHVPDVPASNASLQTQKFNEEVARIETSSFCHQEFDSMFTCQYVNACKDCQV